MIPGADLEEAQEEARVWEQTLEAAWIAARAETMARASAEEAAADRVREERQAAARAAAAADSEEPDSDAGPNWDVTVSEEERCGPSAPPLLDMPGSSPLGALWQPDTSVLAVTVPFVDYGQLTVLYHLASGSFKAVWRANWQQSSSPADRNPRTVALLVLRVGSVSAEKAMFEKLGRHPCLTQVFAMTVNEAGQECLIAEYAEHGSLDVYLQQQQEAGVGVSSEVLLAAAAQICDGMARLAVHGIIHRDLAARNVLVFWMHPLDRRKVVVKITDYGLAVHGSSVSTMSAHGSGAGPLRWMAPEAIARRRYTQQSDVFAFGVTLWEMWSMGAVPWNAFSDAETAQAVQLGQRLAAPEGCPEDVCAVMKLCWTNDPTGRPSFLQLRADLQDVRKRASGEELGLLCVVCLTRDPAVDLFPCCHRCLCDSPECKEIIQSKCPICRSDVDSMRQIYNP